MRGGDALVLEDGRLIEVVAAPEPLLEIRCTDPRHLARLAWHLGNRHVPTQCWRSRYASGAITSLRTSDAAWRRVIEIEAPFDPEGGAYLPHRHAHDMSHLPTPTPVPGKRGPRRRCAGMMRPDRSRDALYRLLTWLSPAYPVGAFSYSSGIEWAVEAGDITDVATLRVGWKQFLSDGRRNERRHLLRAGASRRDTAATMPALPRSRSSRPLSCRPRAL